jgi:hypothetical protein
MNPASRSARAALYRDFYDLIPLFSSFSHRPIVRRSVRCAPIPIKRSISNIPNCRLQVEAQPSQDNPLPLKPQQHGSRHRELPLACPGCGALSQSVHPHEAGFYSDSRAAVRKYLDPSPVQPSQESQTEDELVRNALVNVPRELRDQLGMDGLETTPGTMHNSYYQTWN